MLLTAAAALLAQRGAMGSLAQMITRHVFGLKPDVRGNVWYLDEQTVLYPAGHNIVIFNTEQKTQKFIAGTEKTEGITAMAVSPNKKYVAVAERASYIGRIRDLCKLCASAWVDQQEAA